MRTRFRILAVAALATVAVISAQAAAVAGWSPWETHLGAPSGEAFWPIASSWGPNRLDVFVLNPDLQIAHRAYNGTSWSPWDSSLGAPNDRGEATPGRGQHDHG
jgi:hypothetical protein